MKTCFLIRISFLNNSYLVGSLSDVSPVFENLSLSTLKLAKSIKLNASLLRVVLSSSASNPNLDINFEVLDFFFTVSCFSFFLRMSPLILSLTLLTNSLKFCLLLKGLITELDILLMMTKAVSLIAL